jgi:pilus assembly protein Flp/PilA
MQFFYRFIRDEGGATAIEYAFIAAIVSLSIVAGATTIGKNLAPIFVNVAKQL